MLESLKTIVKTNSDKKLFDGDLQVSYGEFYNLVRQDMASQDNRKHVISTHSLLNQLVRFVSKLCQKALPIICKPNLTHNEISRLEKEVQYAPQLADFGVLSSGTTADAKL
ncbi:TPA: AMP-binding protein, partial [Streptococcus agalactiae]